MAKPGVCACCRKARVVMVAYVALCTACDGEAYAIALANGHGAPA